MRPPGGAPHLISKGSMLSLASVPASVLSICFWINWSRVGKLSRKGPEMDGVPSQIPEGVIAETRRSSKRLADQKELFAMNL